MWAWLRDHLIMRMGRGCKSYNQNYLYVMQSNTLSLISEVYREEQTCIFTAHWLLWSFIYQPAAISSKSIWPKFWSWIKRDPYCMSLNLVLCTERRGGLNNNIKCFLLPCLPAATWWWCRLRGRLWWSLRMSRALTVAWHVAPERPSTSRDNKPTSTTPPASASHGLQTQMTPTVETKCCCSPFRTHSTPSLQWVSPSEMHHVLFDWADFFLQITLYPTICFNLLIYFKHCINLISDM